jgi:hypothetical protein
MNTMCLRSIVLIIALSMASEVLADDVALPGIYTPAQIKAACDAAHGDYYRPGDPNFDRNGFGCAADSGLVGCESRTGKCTITCSPGDKNASLSPPFCRK